MKERSIYKVERVEARVYEFCIEAPHRVMCVLLSNKWGVEGPGGGKNIRGRLALTTRFFGSEAELLGKTVVVACDKETHKPLRAYFEEHPEVTIARNVQVDPNQFVYEGDIIRLRGDERV